MALHRIVGFALTSREGGLHCGTLVAQIGLAAALAVGMACASASTARAGDYDDPSGASFGSQILKAIGLPDPDHPEYEINYSELSPLVVPPNRNLPAPIATDKAPAPNWPQDPDLKKRQAATAKSDKPIRPVDPVIEDGRPLRPDELIAKGSPSAASSSPGIEQKGGRGLLSFDWFKKEEYGTFTGEPSGQPDRSTAGIPNAIPGSPLWNSAGSQAGEEPQLGRALGDTALRCAGIACAHMVDRRGRRNSSTPGEDEIS
jgi:hypothetical protein